MRNTKKNQKNLREIQKIKNPKKLVIFRFNSKIIIIIIIIIIKIIQEILK